MSYLVMECHKSYAVVVSEDARFLKVANLNYHVGQKVGKVIELSVIEETRNRINIRKILIASVSAAASFAIIAIGTWQLCFVSVATLHLQINPKIDMDINRLGYVIDIKAINEDANKLLEGSQFSTAKAEDMATNISIIAKKEHYLDDDKNIYIEVSSDDKSLSSSLELKLKRSLENSLGDDVKVHIGNETVSNTEVLETAATEENIEISTPDSSMQESAADPNTGSADQTQSAQPNRKSAAPIRSSAYNDDDDDQNPDPAATQPEDNDDDN